MAESLCYTQAAASLMARQMGWYIHLHAGTGNHYDWPLQATVLLVYKVVRMLLWYRLEAWQQ